MSESASKDAANADPRQIKPLARLWLNRFKNYRDGLLVAVGILYILGYSVWTVYAWLNHLGLLPALQAQYFMAGIFPALMLCTVYVAILRLGRGFLISVQAFLLAVLSVQIVSFISGSGGLQLFRTFVLFVSYLARWTLVWVLIILLALGSLILYVALFSYVPQELGGLHPRCAYLHIVKAKASPEMIHDLVPPVRRETTPGAEVIRSVQVDLLFAGSDFMLLRRHSAPGTRGHLELKKDIIVAVETCD